MREVAEEWRTTWAKVRLDYDKDVREILQGDNDFLELLKRYIQRGRWYLKQVVDMEVNAYFLANTLR
jgi:hypothetical protein